MDLKSFWLYMCLSKIIVYSLSAPKNNTYESEYANWNLHQPGPEDIECFIGDCPINWDTCRSTFQVLSHDISIFPGPHIWGRGGIHEAHWQSAGSACRIFVNAEDWSKVESYRFSYSLVYRMAQTILNHCRWEAGQYGMSGRAEIAPLILVGIYGAVEVSLSSASLTQNESNGQIISRP